MNEENNEILKEVSNSMAETLSLISKTFTDKETLKRIANDFSCLLDAFQKEFNGGPGSGNHNPGQGQGVGKPGSGHSLSGLYKKYNETLKSASENARLLSKDEYKKVLDDYDVENLNDEEQSLINEYVGSPEVGNSIRLNSEVVSPDEYRGYLDGQKMTEEQEKKYKALIDENKKLREEYVRSMNENGEKTGKYDADPKITKKIVENNKKIEEFGNVSYAKIAEEKKSLCLFDDIKNYLNDDAFDEHFVVNTEKYSSSNEANYSYNDLKKIDDFTLSKLEGKLRKISTKKADDKDFYRQSYARQLHRAIENEQNRRRMDSLIDKKGAVLDKDIIVTRRFNSKEYGYIQESIENIGYYTRRGFTSTSASQSLAQITPGGMDLGSDIVYIIIPKGTKFLPVEKVLKENKREKISAAIMNQHEILLPSDTTFISGFYNDVENKKIQGHIQSDLKGGEIRDILYAIKEANNG